MINLDTASIYSSRVYAIYQLEPVIYACVDEMGLPVPACTLALPEALRLIRAFLANICNWLGRPKSAAQSSLSSLKNLFEDRRDERDYMDSH